MGVWDTAKANAQKGGGMANTYGKPDTVVKNTQAGHNAGKKK